MLPRHTTTVNFLRKINDELFFRIYAGNFAYQRDLAQLSKYIQIATEVGAHGLVGRLRITEMLLRIVCGEFDAAFEVVEQAIADYERETDPVIKAENLSCYSNRAELHHMIGDNHTAIALFDDLLKRIAADPIYTAANVYYFYMISGICNLELERYDTAKTLFARVLAHQDGDPQFAEAVSESYRGLSECYLHEGDFDRAHRTALLANDIAERTKAAIQLFYAKTALAHIAEKTSAPDLLTVDEYYQAAITAAVRIGTPTLRAIAFLHEARYHQRHANIDKRREFARRAADLLHANRINHLNVELSNLIRN